MYLKCNYVHHNVQLNVIMFYCPGFVVMYTVGMGNEDAMWKVESRVSKNIRTTVVRNLRPRTRYSFRVQSEQSRFDSGLESSVVNFDTSYGRSHASIICSSSRLNL